MSSGDLILFIKRLLIGLLALLSVGALAQKVYVNDGGTLRKIHEIYINDNGTLREIRAGYVNDGGVLRQIYVAVPVRILWRLDIILAKRSLMIHDETHANTTKGAAEKGGNPLCAERKLNGSTMLSCHYPR